MTDSVQPQRRIPIPALADVSMDTATQLAFTATLLTPMMGGGVVARLADPQHAVRGRSLKHQLRFWWRRLARHGQLPEQNGTGWDNRELYQQERDRFGGLQDDGKPAASALQVQVAACNQPMICGVSGYRPLVGYALFPARPARGDEEPMALVRDGFKFKITLNVVKPWLHWKEELILAMRHWAHLGWVGARGSRGLGAVGVQDVNGQVLQALSDHEMAQLRIRAVLRTMKPACALDAWCEAVQRMHLFRQGHVHVNEPPAATGPVVRPYGRFVYSEKKKKKFYRPGRTTWWDANAVRQLAGIPGPGGGPVRAPVLFPRAAFGLPVIGREINGKHDDTRVVSEGSFEIHPWDGEKRMDRMRSPVWIRPVPVDGGYVAAAFLLEDWAQEALKGKVHVKFTPADHPTRSVVRVESGDHSIWPADAGEAARVAASMEPMRLGGPGATDPLQAFMQFFDAP